MNESRKYQLFYVVRRSLLDEDAGAVVVFDAVVPHHHVRGHGVQVDAVRAVVVQEAVGDQHLVAGRLAPHAAVGARAFDALDLDGGARSEEVDVALPAA